MSSRPRSTSTCGWVTALRLGPARLFHDSPKGMRRFRAMTTETAGFHNTVGFKDDTREVAVDLAYRLVKRAHRL